MRRSNPVFVVLVGLAGALAVLTFALLREESDPSELAAAPSEGPASAASRPSETELLPPSDSRAEETPPVPPVAAAPVASEPKPYDEAAWREAMSKEPLEKLIAEQIRVEQELNAKSAPEFQRVFDAGRAEFLGTETTYSYRPEDEETVFSIRMNGQGTYRIVLSRNEYPELYRLKAQRDWLRATVTKRSEARPP